jgi:hypothetical protein
MENDRLAWYQAQNQIMRKMLIRLYNDIAMLPSDKYEPTDYVDDDNVQKEKNEYDGLVAIVLSLQECVELLHLPEQEERESNIE